MRNICNMVSGVDVFVFLCSLDRLTKRELVVADIAERLVRSSA